jgi:biotin synthase
VIATATEPTQDRLNFDAIADAVLAGEAVDRATARRLLETSDDDLLPLLHAAFRIRREHFGRTVSLNVLMNAQSGRCKEDCGYCSQSFRALKPVDEYDLVDKETIVDGARRAQEAGAATYCIVSSGRGPENRALDKICDAVREVKATTNLKVCACLGILREGQAEKLREAGVDRYNHNVNTSENHHAKVTTTHSYDDRVRTVNRAKDAGISPCSGVIVGMGEELEDIVDMAFALQELDAESIPVNFLHPVEGTTLGTRKGPEPMFCLKVLAMFRFVCPGAEIRASGGREVNLRNLQGLALFPANSMFLGDYLTTDGQPAAEDLQMIKDLGFEIAQPRG